MTLQETTFRETITLQETTTFRETMAPRKPRF